VLLAADVRDSHPKFHMQGSLLINAGDDALAPALELPSLCLDFTVKRLLPLNFPDGPYTLTVLSGEARKIIKVLGFQLRRYFERRTSYWI
jgi:hypothetical protein